VHSKERLKRKQKRAKKVSVRKSRISFTSEMTIIRGNKLLLRNICMHIFDKLIHPLNFGIKMY